MSNYLDISKISIDFPTPEGPFQLSSKSMEVKSQAGLYFIGETVDVTGWLGGYNFQWAWSSGWAAGQKV